MEAKFDVIFLEEAVDFLDRIDEKSRWKVIYNIDRSRFKNDPKLFKKLSGNIWEFRTLYKKMQYRLFAFWDKRNEKATLVILTHGIVKKTGKVPKAEIDKAERIRGAYFR